MAESTVAVTQGSGRNLHTWDRTIGATLVQDQFMLAGEYPLASYVVAATSISTATTADHALQIMAGSATYTRIRRIHIQQAANASAAGVLTIDVYRLSTAGTGGTAITPARFDTGDSAAASTAMSLPTAKGTEGTFLFRERMTVRSAYGTNAGMEDEIDWYPKTPGQKSLIIPSGVANGIALKVVTGVTSCTIDIAVEFVETAWLGA